MAYSLTDQLAKVEHDMLKAGYPASDVYLALHNECKKNADQQRSHQYLLLYKQHLDFEEQTKAKAYYGKGLAASLGGAMAAGAQQAIGKVPHMDTALAQQQAQVHMLAQVAQVEKLRRDIIRAAMESDTWVNKDSMKEKIKSAVVTEHVGRKFREDI